MDPKTAVTLPTMLYRTGLQLRHAVSVLLYGAEGGVLVKKVLDTKLDMSGTTPTGHMWSRPTFERGRGSKAMCRQTSTPKWTVSNSRVQTAGWGKTWAARPDWPSSGRPSVPFLPGWRDWSRPGWRSVPRCHSRASGSRPSCSLLWMWIPWWLHSWCQFQSTSQSPPLCSWKSLCRCTRWLLPPPVTASAGRGKTHFCWRRSWRGEGRASAAATSTPKTTWQNTCRRKETWRQLIIFILEHFPLPPDYFHLWFICLEFFSWLTKLCVLNSSRENGSSSNVQI